MGKLNGLLLFYCTLLSLVIVASGLLSAKSENLIFQLLFLPVPLYLIFQVFKGILSFRKPKDQFQLSKKAFFFKQLLGISFFLIIFLVLSFISLVNIVNGGRVSDAKQEIEVPEDQVVLLVTTTEASGAPVYSEATTSADVVFQAKNNDRLVMVDKKPGWYQVLLGQNLKGWILEEFIRLPKTK